MILIFDLKNKILTVTAVNAVEYRLDGWYYGTLPVQNNQFLNYSASALYHKIFSGGKFKIEGF